MKDKILALLKRLGIDFKDKESDFLKELESIDFGEEIGADDLPLRDEPTRKVVSALIEQNKALAGSISVLRQSLSEEKQQRDAAIAAEAKRQETEKASRVANAVKKLLDEKRITEADKPHWQKILEMDFDTSSKLAEGLPVIGAAGKQKDNISPNDDATAKRSFGYAQGPPFGYAQGPLVDRAALKNAIAEQMRS